MNEVKESNALLEVREWRATCDQEVAGLKIGEAVRKRLKDSEESARRMGFSPKDDGTAKRVAETSAAYGVATRNHTPD